MYNNCQRFDNIFFIDLACATSVHYNKLIYLLTRAYRWSGRVTMTTELVYIHVSLYVCITTNQPDTESNPYPNPTTNRHAVVNIQQNSHVSYIAREINTRRCSCTVFFCFPLSLSLFLSVQLHIVGRTVNVRRQQER